jgi:hypothetical protein
MIQEPEARSRKPAKGLDSSHSVSLLSSYARTILASSPAVHKYRYIGLAQTFRSAIL